MSLIVRLQWILGQPGTWKWKVFSLYRGDEVSSILSSGSRNSPMVELRCLSLYGVDVFHGVRQLGSGQLPSGWDVGEGNPSTKPGGLVLTVPQKQRLSPASELHWRPLVVFWWQLRLSCCPSVGLAFVFTQTLKLLNKLKSELNLVLLTIFRGNQGMEHLNFPTFRVNPEPNRLSSKARVHRCFLSEDFLLLQEPPRESVH